MPETATDHVHDGRRRARGGDDGEPLTNTRIVAFVSIIILLVLVVWALRTDRVWWAIYETIMAGVFLGLWVIEVAEDDDRLS